MAGINAAMVLEDPPNSNPDLKEHYTKVFIESAGYIYLSYWTEQKLNEKYPMMVINKISLDRPDINQSAQMYQLDALADSYNRSLYQKIKEGSQ